MTGQQSAILAIDERRADHCLRLSETCLSGVGPVAVARSKLTSPLQKCAKITLALRVTVSVAAQRGGRN